MIDTSEEIAARLHQMTETDGGEERSHPSNPAPYLQDFFGGGMVGSGVRVTESSALSASSVFACVRNIAEDEAKLPLIVYRDLEPTGKERLKGHAVYKLLHDEPNPEMSAFDFRQAMTASAVLWGGGLAEIERGKGEEPSALWPIEPWRWRCDRGQFGGLVYIIDGGKEVLLSDQVVHLKGFSINGILGLMITSVGGESIGLTLAAQKFAASFFGNGLNPGGVISHPKTLSDTAQDRLRRSWAAIHAGPDRAHKPFILEEGATWNDSATAPNEAQMLETRQFQVEDVARWFRMPPHKIGHLLRAAGWSTLEATNQDYITDTLMPWFVKWEQELKRKLIHESEQDEVSIEHLVDAMLRGDSVARAQSLEIQFRNGAINLDQWNALENRNPLPDGMGKYHFVPVNYQTIQRAIEGPEETKPEPTDPAEDPREPEEKPMPAEDAARFDPIIADVATRIRRRETEVLKKAAKKSDTFDEFRESFFADHLDYVRSAIRPVLMVMGRERDIESVSNSYVSGLSDAFKGGVSVEKWAENTAKNLQNTIKEATNGQV